MSKVITFSRVFPSYHPRKGEPTGFVEKVVRSLHEQDVRPWDIDGRIFNEEMYWVCEPKNHTIRAGHRWKAGDWFSPRVWSGKPYNSKQIQFAPDIQVKKVWDFKTDGCDFFLNGELVAYASSPSEIFLTELSKNDGLNEQDLLHWFRYPNEFDGQIICWNESIEY